MAKSIGRYEISEELGRGGMAAVYLAFDPQLGREVALKLMDQQLLGDPAFATRFEREAKTVASLEHGAIVSLYDYGEASGWLYLVMRYMKGGSLKEQIARGPLTLERAYNVVHRIGRALDKAHRMGIIHRDLKPGNILLDEDGESYLSDFGIVKVAKGDAEYLTETGQTLGTFAYMSPEQVLGKELDGRSDIYALGVVLYEMLTGKHPFGDVATTSGAMAVAHTQQPIPDVTQDNPDLPAALAAVIQKALAKDPADRYKAGAEMAAAMRTALARTAGPPAAAGAAATSAVAKSDVQPVRQQPPRRQPAAPTAPPPAQQVEEEKGKRPFWMFVVIGLAVIACIAIVAVPVVYVVYVATPTDTPSPPGEGEEDSTVTPTPSGQPIATDTETAFPTTQTVVPIVTTAAATDTPVPPSPPTLQEVVFPPGGTSAVLESSIAPPSRHTYVFRALGGQSAALEIISQSGTANFSLSGMTDGQPYKRLENEDRSWQGVLPATQDYLLTVASLDATDYSLTLFIAPLAAPTDIPTVDPIEPVPTRIQFQPGAISAAVNGTVVWPEQHFYVFQARAGQTATIDITSAGDAANFSVVGLDDGQPYKRLVNEDRFFSWTLPLTQDYRIGVATAAGQVTYTLTLTIEP